MIGDRTTHDRSAMLDDETVQGALMIAAFVVPIAVSILLPRMIYRAAGREDFAPAPIEIAAAAHSSEMNAPVPTSTESPTTEKARQSGVDAIYRRARQRLKSGDYEGAVCDFDDVLRQKPQFVWCHYYRAGAYSRIGNQTAALADLDRAVDAMPHNARVWRARAVVHQWMGDLLAAVTDISRAVEFVGNSGGRHDAALASGVKAKAEELLTDLFEHATAALKSGDSATAIAEFSEVVRRRPKSASAWLRRAVAYDEACEFDKALNDVNEALRLRPGPAQAYKLRSILHERRSDYVSALADMRAAQRLLPGRAEYVDRIRWLLRQQVLQRGQQVAARWRRR